QTWFSPGDLPLSVHRVAAARIGLMICFDWRFPEVARSLALLGADVLVHPSNLVFANAQDAMLVRSLENRVFAVTANRTGTERRPGGTVPFTGRSQIVAPSGLPLVRAGRTREGAFAADCDLAESRRKSLTPRTPIFRNRRPEFYGAVVAGGARASRPRRRRSS
ncbi:MAG TPA: nitrilase-related carbon-nitrogen hydrolase, partial [Candidatus Acidoferrales bacterium]|nr:nitrilase-related carbon-nitrogen hydrolase [Candidatus Acidoferrales bacterium]